MFHNPEASTVYCKALPQSNFLEEGLKDYYGISELRIQRTKLGKPYSDKLPGSFSLSHSGDLAALYINPFLPSAGCDLQVVKAGYSEEELSMAYFTKEERALGLAFFHMWTLKEAFLKEQGLSVFDMGSVSVARRIGEFRSWTLFYGGRNYYLSLFPATDPLSLSFPCPLKRVL